MSYYQNQLLEPYEKLFIAFVKFQLQEDANWFLESEKRIYILADMCGVNYECCDYILIKLKKLRKNKPTPKDLRS